MSILYKILMFLWFFYMISMFVHALDIFPYTPFSDIGGDPVYAMATTGDSGFNKSSSILDIFFYYDADLGILGNFHVTSLTILGICITIGIVITVFWSPDIRIIIVALTIGMALVMLNSSWTFMHKILTVEGGVAMTTLVVIIGTAILFILVITIADKASQSGGGAED